MSFDAPEESLLKTLLEKEEVLETSIYSFYHNVFLLIQKKLHHLIQNEIFICKCFQYGIG